MNFFKKSLVVMSLAAASLIVFAQGQNPTELLKQINDAYAAKVKEARDAGKTVNTQELLAMRKTMAENAVKGIDAMHVEPGQGLAWAQLFQIAGKMKDACMAAERYLTSNPDASSKYAAQNIMINACNAQGEAKEVLKLLMEMQPADFNQKVGLAMNTIHGYKDTINEKLGLNEALRAFDRADAILNGLEATTEQQKAQIESYKATSVTERATLLYDNGKKDDAIAILDKAVAGLPANSPSLRAIKSAKTRMTLTGSVAPALNIERGYGAFASLADMKGKVVIIDFFAHWCGPCKAAFPDMRKMYDDLKDKGLEILGVTTYYGYYGQEKNLSKDDEYAKMEGFMKDFNMNWPVVYGERSNFEAYGITGIPTTIVVGRDGKVHKLHVGYSADSFKAFRAEVEELLKAK